MDTSEIENLKIVDEDDGTTYCERGVVHTNGEAAVIYDWDPKRGKFIQKDRLTEANIKRGNKNTSQLTGVSQDLLNNVGVPKDKAILHLKLHHEQGKPLTRD